MKTVAAVAVALAALLLPAGAGAAAGSLDRSFSGNGKLTVRAAPDPRVERFPYSSVQQIPMASAAGPKGELLAANDRRVLRFRADGRPRRYFGGNGRAVIPAPAGTGFQLAGLAGDSRGRVLVAGTAAAPAGDPPASSIVVYRFLPNGKLDDSFAHHGVALVGTSPFGGESVQPTGLAVDSANRPVLTGFALGEPTICTGGYPPERVIYPNRTLVLRLTNGGALDSRFGSGGFQTEPALEDPSLPAIAGSGQIVFANRIEPRCTGGDARGEAPALTVLGPSGAFESRFPVAPDGGFEYIYSLALDVDRRNRIVVLFLRTLGEGGGDRRFLVRRLLPDGTLDTSFGEGGEVRPPLPPGGAPAALVTDGRNRVVLAGTTPRGQDASAFLALRLNAAGKLQRWFGDDGYAITRFGKRAKPAATQVHRDSSGRIVLGGTIEAPYLSTGYGLAFARYLSGGR